MKSYNDSGLYITPYTYVLLAPYTYIDFPTCLQAVYPSLYTFIIYYIQCSTFLHPVLTTSQNISLFSLSLLHTCLPQCYILLYIVFLYFNFCTILCLRFLFGLLLECFSFHTHHVIIVAKLITSLNCNFTTSLIKLSSLSNEHICQFNSLLNSFLSCLLSVHIHEDIQLSC